MIVDGFALLDICRSNRQSTALLTGHAVNVESVNRAMKLGAISFLPKEKLPPTPGTWRRNTRRVEKGRKSLAQTFSAARSFLEEKLGPVREDVEKSEFRRKYC
jgi:hypothetical protein